jgi:DNA-binding CsgD family transcriptional regulator
MQRPHAKLEASPTQSSQDTHMESQSLSLLIRDLYAAAAEPERWKDFLYSMKNTIGGTACSIIVRDERRGGSGQHAVSIGIEDEFIRAYKDYYSSINIVYDAALAIAPDRSYIGTLQSCIDMETYKKSEIYNDYARPQNLFHQCSALLARKESYAAAISFMRPECDGPYGDEHVQLLKLLAPHLCQAFQLHNTLRSFETSLAGLNEALDQSETAIFLLDGAGRLQKSNTVGHRLIAEGSVLYLRDGLLRPKLQEDSTEFDRLIGLTCATGAGRGLSSGGVMLLHRPLGRPLHCKLTPFYSDKPFWEASPSAIVFVHDPDRPPASRGEVLLSLYGLTPSEAQLADLLLAGETVATAAEKRRTTEESARTQLKTILRKTGTNRQTELIRLMLSIPA